MSFEPSSRRRRSNSGGDFHPVVSNIAYSDLPSGLVVYVVSFVVSVSLERSVLHISRVFFHQKKLR